MMREPREGKGSERAQEQNQRQGDDRDNQTIAEIQVKAPICPNTRVSLYGRIHGQAKGVAKNLALRLE